MASYTPPELPTGTRITNLRKEDDKANELTPETMVTCINRGPLALVDMFDGQNYVIPPGHFMAPYGAALHFQRRQVVPGTRIPGQGHKSWVSILGIDKAEVCLPFTDAELEAFGQAREAINREALPGADGQVQIIGTAGARATLAGEGLVGGFAPVMGAGPQRPDLSVEGDTPAGREAAGHALERPGVSEARAEEAEARGAGWRPPVDDGTTASVPVPTAERLAHAPTRGRGRNR